MRKDFEELVFLYGVEDRVLVYQLKESECCNDYALRSYNYIKNKGLKVKRDNYHMVYSEPLQKPVRLENIYERLNGSHIKTFLSVSDIIVIHRNGENKAYYVDSIGFTEITDIFSEYLEGAFGIAEYYVELHRTKEGYAYGVYDSSMKLKESGSVVGNENEFVGAFCEVFDKLKEDDELYGNITEDTEFVILDHAEFKKQIKK